MHKKWQDFQNFNQKFKTIVYFFYIDLFFIVLTFISSYLDFNYSKALTLFLITFDIVLLVATVLHLKTNQDMIDQLEDMFLSDNYGSMSSKIASFQKLIENNFFHYHFQPIIDAKTGDIFAYEALMRTDPETIDLHPLEILDLATKENRLYDIEKYTFYNTLKLMEENTDVFQNKKLFINSISTHQLTDVDFEELYHNYSSFFRNVVMEITETIILSEEGLKLINKRLHETHCLLALEDYGTGYSNESNILSSSPHYIKIDGSTLRYINVDIKKQHIVTNLINFALQNNIKVIAEGIETYEEFEYVISLGVDYIQGYYTAKPSPVLLQKIPQEIIEKIKEINNRNYGDNTLKRIYETKGDAILSPVALSLAMYSDVLITESEISIQGNQGMIANISLIIPDNHSCNITLDNVNLRGNEKSAIVLGKNCSVVLTLIGDNYISYDGIRVPETSDLMMKGAGNLTIQAERTNRVGIGGTALQAYGNITFASTGVVKIISKGNMSVAIGGGQNPYNSLIHVVSGNLYVETSGYNTVGVGSISGNAKIKIDDGKLKITTEGTKAVGIGSIRGYVDINSAGNLVIKCSGKNVIAFGVMEESDGKIVIRDGSVSIRFNTHYGTGIGALGGRVSIEIHSGDIAIFGEGTDIVGIGDHTGFGDICIKNGIISIQLYATNAIPIGNIRHHVIIDGGNIQCDFPDDIIPVNSYGVPLTARIIMDSDQFSQMVDTVNYAYEYKASYCERFPYIKVYLPDGTAF